MIFQTKLRRIGKSVGIIIPVDKKIGCNVGDIISVDITANKINRYIQDELDKQNIARIANKLKTAESRY